jgi:hypothetical protein
MKKRNDSEQWNLVARLTPRATWMAQEGEEAPRRLAGRPARSRPLWAMLLFIWTLL